MKRFIFLLIMAVFLAGMVFAQDTAHPSGVQALDVVLSGYSVQEAAVTPDTVLAMHGIFALRAGFLVAPNTIDSAGQPHGVYHLIKPLYTGRAVGVMRVHSYWLRL